MLQIHALEFSRDSNPKSVAKEVLEMHVMIFAVHNRRYLLCSSEELSIRHNRSIVPELVDFNLACSIRAGVSREFSHA